MINLTIKFSVVIPTHNRAEQLMLTLASFNMQTYSREKFEVIVVNDGSTDHTKEEVMAFKDKASYRLIYTSTGSKTGRSNARNQGISLAKGRYLIFCDSDFIVIPELIQTFDNYTRKYPRAIISGFPNCWNKVYTQYYPAFSNEQKQEMYTSLKHYGMWKESFWGEDREIFQIFKPENIYTNFKKLENLSSPAMSQKVIKGFMQTDVAPWLLFITRCVSVKKRYVTQVGGFDRSFKKWGLEDLELGFRLYRRGLPFVSIDKTMGFHQEHPREAREMDSHSKNLCLFYNKYSFSEPELNLFAVHYPWAKITKYKDSLRLLEKYKTQGKFNRAKQLEEKWRIAAVNFCKNFV